MNEDKDIKKGKGYGFISSEGKIFLERCFQCGRENYAMAVASGICVWCGFDANEEEEVESDK